jgi:BMFP domain-containing protein YqiC
MQKLMGVLLNTAEIETAAHRAYASRCKIYDLDARIKALEAAIPPNQRTSSPELAKFHQELNQARAEYAASEARLEALKARHAGAVALANLLAAYVQAGKDTQALEAAVENALGGEQTPPAQQGQADSQPAQNAQANGGTETGTFKVLECRESKPGVVRAYCEGPEGKVAVYAKNGNAQTLAGAVGKQVQVKYRKGEKGLIALSVQLIQTKGLPDDRRIR